MKKPPIKAHAEGSLLYITDQHKTYAIPRRIAEKYTVESSVPAADLFEKLEDEYSKAAVLLKGLRLRERLTQAAFAKKIAVTQANLSHMERGRRPIGKIVAKRIQKAFGVNYRYFLE